ncbi:hypothetical protein RND81_12G231800 [Saponaria officinalis]|uniref:TF-B3 domain-containing protein n=1 Tax=Saponaria officinalis TaxID=3572 RepID=A0AAW1HEI7_SAPOF
MVKGLIRFEERDRVCRPLLGSNIRNSDKPSSASKEETYCQRYHKYDDGWKKCDHCGRGIHYDCIMALNTFQWNDARGITCKECVEKKNLMASNIGSPSSIPNPVNCSLLNDSSSFNENFTEDITQPPPLLHSGEEFLTDPWIATLLNNDPQTPGNAAIERNLEQYLLTEPGLTFLFQKRLSETDCSITAGRLLLPKHSAEKFLPMPREQHRMPLVIKDAEGQTWKVSLRSSAHGNSRKYEIDGIRRCIRKMQWKTGDTLKFYRQRNGELFMELVRRNPKTSTS